MRLSFAEARRLNIDPAVIDRARRRPDAPAPVVSDDGMNRLERRFAGTLDGAAAARLIRQWEFQPVTFRLAGRTKFTPDFGVWPEPASDWRFTLCETKGWLREDAALKIKVAADMFPQFRWLLVYREEGGGWRVHEVTRSGIARRPIVVPWVNG
jgi:hypothetical protein